MKGISHSGCLLKQIIPWTNGHLMAPFAMFCPYNVHVPMCFDRWPFTYSHTKDGRSRPCMRTSNTLSISEFFSLLCCLFFPLLFPLSLQTSGCWHQWLLHCGAEVVLSPLLEVNWTSSCSWSCFSYHARGSFSSDFGLSGPEFKPLRPEIYLLFNPTFL